MAVGKIERRPSPARGTGFVTLTLCFMVHSGIALADDDHETARRLVQAGTILPLEKILATQQNIQQGRILEVELQRHHGKFIYEVEWVNRQGIVWESEFDATNGTLLEQKRED